VFPFVLAVAATITSLAGCSNWTLGEKPSAYSESNSVQRSTLRLAKVPADAAACIAKNARDAGRFAEVVPLYGMESVAVTVKTSAVGDALAVLSLTSDDGGAVAATSTWAGVPEREAFLGKLVQGC
jgi:hypothetical protein